MALNLGGSLVLLTRQVSLTSRRNVVRNENGYTNFSMQVAWCIVDLSVYEQTVVCLT